jgi:hypothetical protein
MTFATAAPRPSLVLSEDLHVGVDRQRPDVRAQPAVIAGPHPDEVELREHPDAAQQDHDEEHRPDLGQRHVSEAAPGGGAVHLRRLVQLGWDRLQARQHTDHHEGEIGPHAHRDQRVHHGVRREPDERLADQPDREERMVDEAVLVVQEPLPEDDRYDGRHHVGEQDDPAHEAPAAELPVEEQRGGDAENELESDRAEGESEPQPDAPPELGSWAVRR